MPMEEEEEEEEEESIIAEVDIVSFSNYMLLVGRPFDSQNRILYSPLVKGGDVRSLS